MDSTTDGRPPLLVRRAHGPQAAAILDAVTSPTDGPVPSAGPDAVVLWLGDVSPHAAQPLGAALVDVDDDDAILVLVVVDPAQRGLGLGERLVREAAAHARAQGRARLVTPAPRSAAIAAIIDRGGFRCAPDGRWALEL